jgi:transcription antitermination factor NusG
MGSYYQKSDNSYRDPQWFALITKYRHEKNVNALLSEKGYDSYLPLCDQIRYWSDRKKKVKVPLFNCYLFVNIDLKDRIPVLQTEGVVRFVSFENRPASIPDYQIEWIKNLLNGQRKIEATTDFFEGQKVRVVYGPLYGMEGIYIKNRSRSRLLINLDGILQSLIVEINADEIVPLNRKIDRHPNILINRD